MTYTEWLFAIKAIAGERWGYWCEWYSFRTAFRQGMTPIEAARDCAEWLDEVV
jgi:hypothetical protein